MPGSWVEDLTSILLTSKRFKARERRNEQDRFPSPIELIIEYRSIGGGQGGLREDSMFYGREADM
ncbi:MAG: hypothetical protein ABI234_13290 [Ktedonobacteraceae bacterium]